MKAPEDIIIEHYRRLRKHPNPVAQFAPEHTLTNTAIGLGDTIILTDVLRASQGRQRVWSGSPHWNQYQEFLPYPLQDSHTVQISACHLIRQFDCGNGHKIQRLRRAFGYPVDDTPASFLLTDIAPHPNRVFIHYEPAARPSSWQRKFVHPRAREVYPSTRFEIQRFIFAHPEYEYISIGYEDPHIQGAVWIKTNSTGELIKLIATGSYYIGITSGPLHVAAALGLKAIVLINFPTPDKVILPCLVPTDVTDEEWLYPQHVHLHQDAGGPLAPKFSYDNLERAFNGEIYPFFSNKHLSLIHEKLA
jgi:hypothetical protein